MAIPIDQIRREALSLTAEERARLAGELISSLDDLGEEDQAAVDAAWAVEVQRRVDEIRRGSVTLLNGGEVMDDLRQRLKK